MLELIGGSECQALLVPRLQCPPLLNSMYCVGLGSGFCSFVMAPLEADRLNATCLGER